MTPEEFSKLLAKAEQGDYEAMYAVAVAFWEGDGTEKDRQQTVHWTRRAAEEGEHPRAMGMLGHFLYFGVDIPEDEDEAFFWMKKAADAGHPVAIHEIGKWYWLGYGIDEDPQMAFYWIHRAAELDIPEAMFILSFFFVRGMAQPKIRRSPFVGRCRLLSTIGQRPWFM